STTWRSPRPTTPTPPPSPSRRSSPWPSPPWPSPCTPAATSAPADPPTPPSAPPRAGLAPQARGHGAVTQPWREAERRIGGRASRRKRRRSRWCFVALLRPKEGTAPMDLFAPSIVWHHSDSNETQLWFMEAERIARRGTVLGEDGQPAFIGP